MAPFTVEMASALGMMQMEEDRQEAALDQIDDHETEERPCIKCKDEYSENCFRDHHFCWCIGHGKMVRKGGDCPEKKDGECDYVEFGDDRGAQDEWHKAHMESRFAND